jgi:FixJ family two-component response regulator
LHEDTNVAHIPVVVLSASPEIDLAEIAQAAGAETFLTKPVRLQTLIDVIQRYTSG